MDSSNNISSINELSASTIYGTIATASQPNINSFGILDIVNHDGSTQGLSLGGVLVTATAAQINSIFSGGGGGGGGSFGSLTISGNLTLSGANGSNVGLILGSTLVTASGTELNYLDGTVLGVANPNTVMSTDNNNNIGNINELSAQSLTAPYIYGNVEWASQPSITSLGTLTSLNVSGPTTLTDITTNGTLTSLLSNWTTITSAPASSYLGVAYSPELNLYVGITAISNTATGAFASSVDGLTWTARNAPAAQPWQLVRWISTSRQFIAVANCRFGSVTNGIAISTDGINWTGFNAPLNNPYSDITYNPYSELYYLAPYSPNGNTVAGYITKIMNPTSSISWVEISASQNAYGGCSALEYWSGFGYYYNTIFGGLATTTVGFTYMNFDPVNLVFTNQLSTTISISSANVYCPMVYSVELNIAVGVIANASSASNCVYYTTNGTTLTTSNASVAGLWFRLVWISSIGLFIAISSDATPKMMKSSDGITWTTVTLPVGLGQLSDMQWFNSISKLVLVSSVTSSSYSFTISSLTNNTTLNLATNNQYSSIKSSIKTVSDTIYNSGLFGNHNWVNNDTSNNVKQLMKLTSNGLIIGKYLKSQPEAALDITTLPNSKSLVIKSSDNNYGLGLTLDTTGLLTSKFVNGYSSNWRFDHTVTIGTTSSTASTSKTTGQLVVAGGIGASGAIYANDLVTNGSVNKSLLNNWTYQVSVPANNWSSIAYSPSLKIFLAVANNTSGTVLIRSTDGITWTNLSSPSSGNAFIDILWVEDIKAFITFTYTAGGNNISICISTNGGTSWTLVGLGVGSRITDINYIKETGLFLFTARTTALTNDQMYWVGNSNSVYAAGNMSYASTTTAMSINKIAYSALWSRYYVLEWNSSGSTTVRIEYSTNINWSGAIVTTVSGLPRAKVFRCLCEGFEIGTMIAVATDTGGSAGSVLYTTNGTSWTQATAASSSSWFKAVWVPELGLFVVISSDSTPAMMTSPNGITWTSVTLPTGWTTLSDIKWFPEIGTLSLVSSISGSTYNINNSYFTATTSMNYLTNPTYSSVVTSMKAGPMLNINTGLNGGCRWLTTNSSNSENEVMRLSNVGLSINSSQGSVAALDITSSLVKNNNKVLRLKTNTFGWNYDYTFSSANAYAATLTTSFSGGGNSGTAFTNMTLAMNHCLSIAGAIASTSTTTGSLIVTGGTGISGNLNIGGGLSTGTSGYSIYMGDQFYHIRESNGPYGATGTSPAYFTKQAIRSPQLGLFVVTTGTTNVMYSSNGSVWNSSTSSARTWEGITWADGLGLFVAVANDSGTTTGQIMTSSNGTSWTARNGPASNNGGNWNSVCWSPQLQLLVACSSVGTTNSYGLMRSSDGITWTVINHTNTTNTATSFRQVIWNSYSNQFVACGNGQFAVSSNGTSWTIYNTSSATGQFQCVAYSPVLGSYFASSSSSTSACAVSTNGTTWTTTTFGQISNRMVWIPSLNAFITSSKTDYDAWTRNGTSYNSLARAYGNSSNFDICYAPDIDVIIMTMPANNTANENIIISASVSTSRLNLAYNNNMSKTNQISLLVDSNVNLTSGYNSGHRFYNASTLTGSKNNMLATIMPIIGSGTTTTPSFGLGVATPAAQIDIQTSATGEFQRIRSPFSIGSLKYLSLGIDSNYGLTLTSSTATDATSTTSGGTLTVTGGAAISKSLFVGNTVTASLPSGGAGFSHTAGSQTLSTYYDSVSTNIGLGTTTNNNLNFFTNNRYGSTGALSLVASNNFVSINTTLTGTSGMFGNAINVSSYIQATQDYCVWVANKGNSVYSPIPAAINNAGHNPWIGLQNGVFNMPTSIGYTLTGPVAVIQSGYLNPSYTETYTFTITYTYLFYKVWVNGVLVANNQSINTTTSTASFTVACTASVPISLYVQLIGKNGSAGSCNFSMVYQSTSQTSTAPTWSSSDGCFNYIKTQPMSCPALFTVYDMTTASTSLMKAEVLCNTSGNMVLKSSGLTTTIDSSNSLNIAGHNGSTLGLQLNGTLVTATAVQLNYTNVTAGTASASKALVLDSSSDITAINNLSLTGVITTTNTTDSSSTSTGSIITYGGVGIDKNLSVGGSLTNVSTVDSSSTITGAITTAGGVGIAKKLYVGDGIYGTLQTAAQPNITSVGTLNGLLLDTATTLTIGSTSVTETGISYISGITAGTAAASKALVLDSSSEISGISSLSATTIVATDLTGTIQTATQPNITSVGTLNGLTLDTATTLTIGSTSVTETGISYISGITAGTAAASKALVLDSSSEISGISSLSATTLTGTLSTASQPNITSVSTLDITSHNASTQGLALGGTLITASATEINYIDTTPGTASASKALVLDSSSNITGINNLSATSLTGTLQTSSQPNLTSIGTLSGLTLGTGTALTIGATAITESDLVALASVTHGTAAADRVLILDSNSDISSINKISSALINVASATNSTLPLEVGVVSYAYTGAHAYFNSTNSLGVSAVNVSAASANWSLRCDGRALFTGEINVTSDFRLKKNINKLSLELAKEFIMTSNPVSFNWITDDNQTDYGFIAQQVAANPKFKDLVNIVPHEGLEEGIDEETGVLNPADHKYVLAPGKIIPLLVLTNKDLYKQLEEKDKKIDDLEERLAKLEEIIRLLNL